MKHLEDLANEALDAMELVRQKISDIIEEATNTEGNEELLALIDNNGSKFIACYSLLEDIYSIIEDMKDAA